jgi:hypothetical protein
MQSEDVDLRTTTAMMLASLVKKEEEFNLLRADNAVLNFIVQQMSSMDTNYDTFFSETELVVGLRKLSVNDDNKV